MKFLCPSCKAKYQIADDKVAGRSVRMKCRKCGHLINIAKTVTEGSAARKLSSAPPPPDPSESPKVAVPKAAPPPRRPLPSAPGAREPARASAPGPPPRPVARPAPSPVTPPSRLGAASPGLQGYGEPAPQRDRPKNGNGSSHSGFGAPVARWEDERTVIAGMGALADAFSESMAGPESSALASSLASTDEWYVGINGVPVGPIRLSEVRSKAAVGAITNESLVWREGFEQWLPLSNFPELVAIVEEGLSSARASLTPLSPSASHPPAPPAAPRPEVYDPFAMPGQASAPLASEPFQLMPRQAGFGDQAALPPAVAALGPVTGPAVVTEAPRLEAEELALPVKRSGTSVFAWVAVGVAMMLGLTIGFVMFSKKPPEPIVKYVEVPAKAGDPAVQASGAAPVGEQQVIEIEGDAGTQRVVRGPGVGGTAKPGNGDKTEEKPIAGLQGLQGLQGTGPASGPGTGPAGGSTGGQPLDSGEIQKTVGKYTGSVKRSCWQPALDARQKDAPTSARVNVSIVVAPSGSVQSVSTSGDPKGYPGLAGCIASRVKGWQFPASSGSTTVNVPFVFASQ